MGMLDWISPKVRPGALTSGHGAPSADPGVPWGEYLNKDDGTTWVWDGSEWTQYATGGGGGGGGGGAVTVANGADIAQGATSDAIVAAGAAGTLSAKLRRVTQGLEDLKTGIVLAAGSAILGKVGIDQTTPGTTDSVSVATGQGAGATIGATGDASAAAGGTGTLSAKLRLLTSQINTLTSLFPVALTGSGNFKTAISEAIAAGSNLIGSVMAYAQTDAIYNGTTALTPKFAVITASSSGATTIVSAVTSKKIRVLSYVVVANAAVNAKFQSHATPTDKTGLLYLGANGGVAAPYSPVGHFETVAGEALDINLASAVAVGGHLVYVEV